jgi:transglutaminase-like putative cysteine protease
MKQTALQDHRTATVRSLAESLGSPQGVDEYLRRTWRVVPDPVEAEYIRAPVFQIQFLNEFGYLEGDCDDASTLAASLLAALSIPCEFRACRLHGDDEFSHVWCRSQGIDIDPIVPAEALPIKNYAELMQVIVV